MGVEGREANLARIEEPDVEIWRDQRVVQERLVRDHRVLKPAEIGSATANVKVIERFESASARVTASQNGSRSPRSVRESAARPAP